MSKPPKLSDDVHLERSIDRVFDVLAKSCGEDEAGSLLGPLVNAINTILPFYPNPDHPAECEQYIKRVFEAVVKHYGEDEARRIFGPYGKPRTKREKSLKKMPCFWGEYCLENVKTKGRPNVRQLAVRLAKEKNLDPGAMERKIWRAIKSKKAQRYLFEH